MRVLDIDKVAMLTAPPLRLPGAVGSPTTPVSNV